MSNYLTSKRLPRFGTFVAFWEYKEKIHSLTFEWIGENLFVLDSSNTCWGSPKTTQEFVEIGLSDKVQGVNFVELLK